MIYKIPMRIKAEEACIVIHKLLESLPIYRSPRDVPFKNGLYFFYQLDEKSSHAFQGRIVRIGNHPRSHDGLIRRLWNHYSGKKNGSVFRKFLGGSIIRRDDSESPCLKPIPGKGHWEKQDSLVCEKCRPLETIVSELLRREFWFRCVKIDDRPLRNQFEEILVSTISSCTVCLTSSGWLGHWAYSEKVRNSGMWNSDFTDDGKIIDDVILQRSREAILNSR